MGFDLLPKSKTATPLRYNHAGWRFLQEFILDGVRALRISHVVHLPMMNDGKLIPDTECRLVAQIIRAHAKSLSKEDAAWIRSHAESWEKSGGFHVF